jgi:folate-binding protein YgfZ
MGVVRVTGSDGSSFLQGQFTNDLQQPNVNLTYGLWLNQKGRVVADSHVLRLATGDSLLVSADTPAAVITQRLEQYIIADDVLVTDEAARFGGLTAWGPENGALMKSVFGAVPERGRYLSSASLCGFVGCWKGGANFEIIGPQPEIAELSNRLRQSAGREVGPEAMKLARVLTGTPAVPLDIGPGDLPPEGGLDLTAISYNKGCYLGQEIMARLKSMGQLRRRLCVLEGQGLPPPSGTAVFQGGKKAGEFRSVATRPDGFVAMAMLSLLVVNLEADLCLAPDGPATLRLRRHE